MDPFCKGGIYCRVFVVPSCPRLIDIGECIHYQISFADMSVSVYMVVFLGNDCGKGMTNCYSNMVETVNGDH